MKKTLLGGAVLAALVIPLALAPAANATDGDDSTAWRLTAWQTPDDGSVWPQTFAAEKYLPWGGDNVPELLGALDDELAALPGCHEYQIDLYVDNSDTDSVLADGKLYPHEDTDLGILPNGAYKFFRQTEGCTFDATSFNAEPNPATCFAAGTFDVPLGGVRNPWNSNAYSFDRGNVTLLVDRSVPGVVNLYVFTNDGQTTLTGLSAAWTINADGRSATRTITLAPQDTTSEVCIPDIGGKTIGFWTNKNGAPIAQTLWASAIAPYSSGIGHLTYAQGQTALKVTGSTNLGKDMLRAQFIATALNVPHIAGYGDQHITVPASSAVDGGQTVKITEYLADINTAWASLDTKAEITSVQEVLNAINQDVASSLIV